MTDEERIWNYLLEKLKNKYSAAGVMGNLDAESSLRPNNVEGRFEKEKGVTDEGYTNAVDSGEYPAELFINDGAGYGIAQWTYYTRKEALLQYVKERGTSIGDLDAQLDFLWAEFCRKRSAVLEPLLAAVSVREASDIVMLKYEIPNNQSEQNQTARAERGQKFYDKYVNRKTEGTAEKEMKKLKVVLDPGHERYDNKGAVSGYTEGTAMFHYAHTLANKLRRYGVDVAVTRNDISDKPSLTERGQMAKDAELFVSLHTNSSSESSAKGVTVFYSIKRDGDKPHAEMLCEELAKLINGGTRARGACTRKGSGDWDYYTVLNASVNAGCPHVFLIEHGFHSNPSECAWLCNCDHLDKMAELECELILRILGCAKEDLPAAEEEAKEDLKAAPGTISIGDRFVLCLLDGKPALIKE